MARKIAEQASYALYLGKFGTYFVHRELHDDMERVTTTELTSEDVLRLLAEGEKAKRSLSYINGHDQGLSSEILSNPCARNAREGEPVFILLGRDIDAGPTVRDWAAAREHREGQSDKVKSAYELSFIMDQYARDNKSRSEALSELAEMDGKHLLDEDNTRPEADHG